MTPLICPACGSTMNHHAEKLLQPTTAEEAMSIDPVLGGMVEEVYACPACGETATRRHGP